MTGTEKEVLALAAGATDLARSWEDAATAALALAEKWERDAADTMRITDVRNQSGHPADIELAGHLDGRRETLLLCARELRSALGGADAGEDGQQ